MPKPVCIPCQRFFRPLRNGVEVLENKPNPGNAEPGLADPTKWFPYKVWRADSWICRGCGATIATGFGKQPIWEDHQGDLLPANRLPVNDC